MNLSTINKVLSHGPILGILYPVLLSASLPAAVDHLFGEAYHLMQQA